MEWLQKILSNAVYTQDGETGCRGDNEKNQ